MTSVSASRVTRSRRGVRLAMTLVAGTVVVLGAFGAPAAQETPVQAPPAAAPDVTPATAPAESEAGPASTDDAQEATPAASQSQPAGEKPAPAGAATRPPKERFEPTEKVRADFDVSFPVDI